MIHYTKRVVRRVFDRKGWINVRPLNDWPERILCNLGKNLYPLILAEFNRGSYQDYP